MCRKLFTIKFAEDRVVREEKIRLSDKKECEDEDELM
jgi:hypothetical protein